jgi:hypothetical protein
MGSNAFALELDRLEAPVEGDDLGLDPTFSRSSRATANAAHPSQFVARA